MIWTKILFLAVQEPWRGDTEGNSNPDWRQPSVSMCPGDAAVGRTYFIIAVTHLNDHRWIRGSAHPVLPVSRLEAGHSYVCVCVCVNFESCQLWVSCWDLIHICSSVRYCAILSKEAAGSTECLNDWLTDWLTDWLWLTNHLTTHGAESFLSS